MAYVQWVFSLDFFFILARSTLFHIFPCFWNFYCVDIGGLDFAFARAMPDIKKLIRDMLKQKDDSQEVASVLSQNKEKAAVDLNLAFGIKFIVFSPAL